MSSDTGKWLIVIGLVFIIAGIVIYFFHDKLGWIGRLPGDIRIERENFRFYFPITTMILLSLLVSFFIWLFRKL
jgi:p-aminobenzoyl-glutamate transporter AbgT